MENILTSILLTLRPATLQDKKKVFHWLAHSNLTNEMLGPPNFPENSIPTWEEFNVDYVDHYFDYSQPLKGQCFIIIHNGQEIGQINYNEIDINTRSTEIDIWLADRKYTRKGLGTEAIKMLCNYLDKSLNCKTIYIAPSKRNINAIKAYYKAGFIETDQFPDNFTPDYIDTVVLIKKNTSSTTNYNSKIIIRTALLQDLSEMQTLFVETINFICKKDYTLEQINAWTSSIENTQRWVDKLTSQYFLVATLNNKIVGYASLEKKDYLDILYVHKDFQRIGIANELYSNIEAEAINLGARILTSDVSITAKPFFDKKGFRTLSEQLNILNGIPILNFKMKKELSF